MDVLLALTLLLVLAPPLSGVLSGSGAGSERALARGRRVLGPSLRALALRSNFPTPPAPGGPQTAPVCVCARVNMWTTLTLQLLRQGVSEDDR